MGTETNNLPDDSNGTVVEEESFNDDELFDQVAGEFEEDDLDNDEDENAGSLEEEGDDTSKPPEEQPTADTPPENEEPGIEERLAAAERERDDWKHRYQSNDGRVSAFQRKAEGFERQLQELQDKQPSQAEADQASEALQNGKWDEFKQDFPEVATSVEAYIATQFGDLKSQVGQLQQTIQPMKETVQSVSDQREEAALAAEHSDWKEIDGSADFHTWLGQQPSTIKGMYGTGAANAAYLINSYKVVKGLNTPAEGGHAPPNEQAETLRKQREQTLETSELPVSRGGHANADLDDEVDLFDSIAKKVERQHHL